MVEIDQEDLTAIRACVQRTLEGDPEAFEPLVRAHQRLVWYVISGFIFPSDTADDLFQQSFLEAYRKLERWDGERSFGNWLSGIARNECLMALRRSQTSARHIDSYRRHVASWAAEAESTTEDPAAGWVSGNSCPDPLLSAET